MAAATYEGLGPALARALEQHTPADDVEARHRASILAWLRGAPRPLARDVFEPGHAVASAFVVCPPRRAALLIAHRRLARWLQPGGHAEPGEDDLRHVAAREAHEELALELDPGALALFDVDVHTIPPARGEPAHDHYDFRYLAVVPSTTFTAGSDARDARWVAHDEMDALGLDGGLRRMFTKARAAGLL